MEASSAPPPETVDFTAVISQRAALRLQNANPTRLAFADLKEMKSDLKKATILAKKFRTYSADQEKALLAEMNTWNMSKFSKEVAQGVAAAIFESKMKAGDAPSLGIVCSVVHQKYEDFFPEVMACIQKSFSFQQLVEEMEQKMEVGAVVDLSRLRVAIRVMCEFWLLGLIPKANFIVGVCVKIATTLDQGQKNGISPHLTTNALNIVSSIVRVVGVEILGSKGGVDGLPSVHGQEACKFHIVDDKLLPVTEVSAADAAVAALRSDNARKNTYATDTERAEFCKRVNTIVQHGIDMCKTLKKGVESRWRTMCEQAEIRGDPTAEQQESFAALKKEAEKFYVLIENIASMVSRGGDMPPPIDLSFALEQSNADQNLIFSSALADFYTVKSAENINYYDDDDQRDFYENLVSVEHLVPTGEIASPTQLTDDDDGPTTAFSDPSPPAGKKSLDYTNIEALMVKLRQCAAKQYIDQWVEEFLTEAGSAYQEGSPYSKQQAQQYCLNCRKILQRELRFASSSSVELLPFFSRLVATLSPCFSEMGELLASKLEGELQVAIKNKTPQSYMRKMRNTRYLCELVKFRITPPIRVLRLFHICMEDLENPHCTEMLCILFEHVASFFMRGGVTRTKMDELLDKLGQKRRKVVMSTEQETMLDNCLANFRQSLLPRKAVIFAGRVRTPLEQFTRKLLFGTMREETFIKVREQIRKMPWNDIVDGDMLCAVLRKCHCVAWNRIHLLAEIVADTCDVHGWVGINIIDSMLEDLRLDLELGKYRDMQQRLQDYKYLGELYNFKLVTFPLLCYTLGMLVLYFPVPCPTNDYSRIRCVCAVLLTSAQYFLKRATPGERQCLRKILAYFYVHVHTRMKPLPMDLDNRLYEVLKLLGKLLGKKRHEWEKVSFPPTPQAANECLRKVLDERVEPSENWLLPIIIALSTQENMRIYPVLRTVVPIGLDTLVLVGGTHATPMESVEAREENDDDSDSDEDSGKDESSSSSSSEDEESVYVAPTMGPLANTNVVKKKNPQLTEEDKEFELMLRDTMKESSVDNVARSQRKSTENRMRNVEVKMAVALESIVKNAREAPSAQRMARNISSAGDAEGHQEDRGGAASSAAAVASSVVKVGVLRRMNDKIEACSIYIPSESEFAQRSSSIVQRHQLETEDLRQRTLLFNRQQEIEAENERTERTAGYRGRGRR